MACIASECVLEALRPPNPMVKTTLCHFICMTPFPKALILMYTDANKCSHCFLSFITNRGLLWLLCVYKYSAEEKSCGELCTLPLL